MCLRLHGRERISLVADPFTGLGSTAVACVDLGVSFIGIEMDEGYLQVAVERTREAIDRRLSKLPMEAGRPGVRPRGSTRGV